MHPIAPKSLFGGAFRKLDKEGVALADVLAYPCGGRRRIVSDVTDPTAVVAVASRGHPSVKLRRAKPRKR